MAKGNILKKRDSDLVSTNIKPWVDIFWVVGWYWGLSWVTSYPLWMAYSANDNDIFDEFDWANDIRFYESWWIIYCMWCVSALCEWWLPWRYFYYLEIRKSDLEVIKRAGFWKYWEETTPSDTTWTYMSIQNISWTDRYCFCCNTLSTLYWARVYFDWTNLVEWGSTWTSIWDTYFDAIIWFSIDQLLWWWNGYDIASTTYFSSWFWQTFNSWTWGDLWAVKVKLKTNWAMWTWNIYCEIYTWAFSTLVWTSSAVPYSLLSSSYNWYTFDFTWITLTPSTSYSFKIYYDWVSNPSRITYETNTSNPYAWWNMYRTWSSFTGVDTTFKIIIWTYIWTFTSSVITRDVQDSYNDYWCATGFLDFA